jgi:hypothetical protein
MNHFGKFLLSVTVAAFSATVCATDEAASDDTDSAWIAHFQSTYIWQQKPAFYSAYSGPNSLDSSDDKSYTWSATAFLGWRPLEHTEIYLNPEVVQGDPFSNLSGLGGAVNGEAQKVTGTNPTLYRARLFLRQTISLGGEQQLVDESADQFADKVDRHRIVITAGNFAANDIFDNNSYDHDPRSQFLNWTIMDYGAWDFAADARGFTRGIAGELYWDDWALRYARLMMPAESNSLPLNPHLFQSYGDNVEAERSYQLNGRPGKLRALYFRNVADMARYSDANVWGIANGVAPQLAPVRKSQAKTGEGISIEQAISDSVGLFGRYSQNDGEGEEFCWTEVDRSAVGGVSINGKAWNRNDDTVGFAMVENNISAAHRDYLAAGGLGFFLGDGQLTHYHSEDIAELYYNLQAVQHFWTTFDIQYIVSPGYNTDRGPVYVFGLRLHAEY